MRYRLDCNQSCPTGVVSCGREVCYIFAFFGRLPAIRPGAENRGRGVYTGKGRGLGHVTTASSSCSGTHSIEGTERGRRSSSSASEAGVILYLRGGERWGWGIDIILTGGDQSGRVRRKKQGVRGQDKKKTDARGRGVFSISSERLLPQGRCNLLQSYIYCG